MYLNVNTSKIPHWGNNHYTHTYTGWEYSFDSIQMMFCSSLQPSRVHTDCLMHGGHSQWDNKKCRDENVWSVHRMYHGQWSVPGHWCWAPETEISRTRGCGHSFLTPGCGVKLRFSAWWLWHWATGISCPRVSIATIRSSQTSHSPQRSWHYLVRKTHCLYVYSQNSWKPKEFFV